MELLKEIKNKGFLLFLIIFTIIIWRISDNYGIIFDSIEKFIGIITPFIYAFVIAYILSPLVTFFDKLYDDKRVVSIACVYAIIIGIIVLSVNYIIPKLGNNIYEFSKSLPGIYGDIKRIFINISQDKRLVAIEEMVGVSADNITDIFSKNVILKITEILQSISSSILKVMISITYELVKWIIGFLVAIYILFYKENFIGFFRITIFRMFGRKRSGKFFDFLKNLNETIGTYIGIKAMDSLIIGTIALIGLVILKSPLAFLFAFVVGITNMIPYFGPFMGMVIVGSIHLFYSPKLAISSIIFLFLLQQFDAWFLDPKLVGNRVGLNPFLIILAITIGGGYFGPIGMILSVPTMALLKMYFLKFIKFQTKRNIEKRRPKTYIESDYK